MKLPEVITQLFHPKIEQRELFFSLILDRRGVAGEVWGFAQDKTSVSLGHVSRPLVVDSWNERLQATDSVIVALEDKVGTRDITKVILGLPVTYLDSAGNIDSAIRPELKKITKELVIKPLGFVSLPQAIIYQLKKEEGVPPSAILIGVSAKFLVVSLYKVGVRAGELIIKQSADVTVGIEQTLKDFTEAEVLPSRMLLYGTEGEELESLRGELLKYPWTSRANFLHFPKIEILATEKILRSVSLAGASEMASGGSTQQEESLFVTPEESTQEVPAETEIRPEIKSTAAEEQIFQGETVTTPSGELTEEAAAIEEPNVKIVAPEELGFKSNVDILEEPVIPRSKARSQAPEPGDESAEEVPVPKPKINFPKVVLPRLPKLSLHLPALRFGKINGAVALGVVVLLVLLYFFYYLVPHATVTVLETAKNLDYTTTITVDPTSSVVDPTNKIIPGQKQEKVVTGTKTIPTTGKKKVGDPAKGTVTIYNGNLNQLTLTKGTVLSANSLNFTLDSDVSIASATPFTKTTGAANVTAKEIGSDGNLPSGTTFSVTGYSLDSAAAKNDQALGGGTSRDVTVVARADVDNLIKLISDELVGKAQQDLAGAVSGGQKLIEGTIKTTVTDKIFTQEIDQESPTLDGKITLSVSGTSYQQADLDNLLKSLAGIPEGYNLVPSRSQITLSNPVVNKNGKISLKVNFTGVALPTLDTVSIQKGLAGLKLTSAQEYLRKITGVAGAEFDFRWSPWKSRLPINKHNITVTIAIQP